MHSFIPHFDRHTKQPEFHHFCALKCIALRSSPSHKSSNFFSELGPVVSSLDYFCTSWWLLSPPWNAVWVLVHLKQVQPAHTDYISLSKHRVMCWTFFSTTRDFHMCTSVSHTKHTPLATKKTQNTNTGMCCWVVLPFMSFISALISLLQRRQQSAMQDREG